MRLRQQGDPLGLSLPVAARKRRDRERKGAGHEGKVELRQETVDSPYAADKTDTVMRNVRENPVTKLVAGGHLVKIQEMAADTFRRYYEALQASDLALDYGKIRVDGGGADPSPSDFLLFAAQQLRLAEAHLGVIDYRIVLEVCGEGKFLTEMVKERWHGLSAGQAKRKRGYLGQRLSDALDALSEMWQLGTPHVADRRGRHVKRDRESN